MKGKNLISVSPKKLEKYAGVKKFRFGEVEDENRIGVVTGLAYTQFGGDILSIEAVTIPGKGGKVSTTGNLKDVMKESITVAEMLIKSRASQFGISYEELKDKGIHVHVPEGAVPKDEKDLADIPDKIKKNLEIIPVKTIEEVLVHALVELPKQLSEEDNPKTPVLSEKTAENKGKDVIHH